MELFDLFSVGSVPLQRSLSVYIKIVQHCVKQAKFVNESNKLCFSEVTATTTGEECLSSQNPGKNTLLKITVAKTTRTHQWQRVSVAFLVCQVERPKLNDSNFLFAKYLKELRQSDIL